MDTVLTDVHDWLREYVSQPAAEIGREGAVCPFVPAALSGETIGFSVRLQQPCTDPSALLVAMAEEFDAFERASQHATPLDSRIVVFPDAGPEGCVVIDEHYHSIKDTAVARELMVAQFHPHCSVPAVRNVDFPVARSPVPLLAMRRMARHDILFLHERGHWFATYRRLFGQLFAEGKTKDPFLRELYEGALERFG